MCIRDSPLFVYKYFADSLVTIDFLHKFIEAVKQAFSDSNELKIRETIGRHIKGAPDRKGGSGRPNKKDKN